MNALIMTPFGFSSTAAEHILNDDVDGAEEGLNGRNSAFHQVCWAQYLRTCLSERNECD
jgi:hypothetical protein